MNNYFNYSLFKIFIKINGVSFLISISRESLKKQLSTIKHILIPLFPKKSLFPLHSLSINYFPLMGEFEYNCITFRSDAAKEALYFKFISFHFISSHLISSHFNRESNFSIIVAHKTIK